MLLILMSRKNKKLLIPEPNSTPGISLLCEGDEEDKIHAVFDVFDTDGDGFISMDEMFKFFTAVFKVVLIRLMGFQDTFGRSGQEPRIAARSISVCATGD